MHFFRGLGLTQQGGKHIWSTSVGEGEGNQFQWTMCPGKGKSAFTPDTKEEIAAIGLDFAVAHVPGSTIRFNANPRGSFATSR